MSLSDWTRSETVSKPSFIKVAWETIPPAGGASEKKTVTLQSTDVSTSESRYQSFSYTDAEGNNQKQDVVVYKEDIRRTTRARVNLEYVIERLRYGLGLPSGNDIERSVTVYEYRNSADGPKLVRDKTTIYISGIALAGQLQDVLYGWQNLDGSYSFYDPPGGEFISHETIVDYDEYRTADGREYTRRRTSRWISAANNPESKGSFVKSMKDLKKRGDITAADVNDAVLGYTGLMFEGTEVQIDIGRLPPPARPSDEDLTSVEVINGRGQSVSDDPVDSYGNDRGWTDFVPDDLDWQDLRDSPRDEDGKPAWADLVPEQWEDYNVEGDTPGIPKWADYVPPADSWEDFVIDTEDWENTALDSDNDGIPDWAEFTPIGWEEFDTADSDYVNPNPAVVTDKVIDGVVTLTDLDFPISDTFSLATGPVAEDAP